MCLFVVFNEVLPSPIILPIPHGVIDRALDRVSVRWHPRRTTTEMWGQGKEESTSIYRLPQPYHELRGLFTQGYFDSPKRCLYARGVNKSRRCLPVEHPRQGEGIPPNSHPCGARHQAQSHQSYGPEGHPIVGGFLHNVFRRGRRFHAFLLSCGRSGVHLRDRGVNLSGTGITLV